MSLYLKTGSPHNGMTYGRDLLRVNMINRLTAQSEAGGYAECWRFQNGSLERGTEASITYEQSLRYHEPVMLWEHVLFLSSFLLARRRQELAEYNPDIPF